MQNMYAELNAAVPCSVPWSVLTSMSRQTSSFNILHSKFQACAVTQVTNN